LAVSTAGARDKNGPDVQSGPDSSPSQCRTSRAASSTLILGRDCASIENNFGYMERECLACIFRWARSQKSRVRRNRLIFPPMLRNTIWFFGRDLFTLNSIIFFQGFVTETRVECAPELRTARIGKSTSHEVQTKFFFKPPLRYRGLKGHDRRALLHEREISCVIVCYCRVSAGAFFFVAASGNCREQ